MERIDNENIRIEEKYNPPYVSAISKKNNDYFSKLQLWIYYIQKIYIN